MSHDAFSNDDLAVTVLLATAVETDPPFSLRRKVLDCAASKRAPPSTSYVSAGTPVATYEERVIALDAQLGMLLRDEWQVPVLGGWNVRDVVVHLAAVDEVVLNMLRGEAPGLTNIAALTDERRLQHSGASFSDVIGAWKRQAQLIADIASEPSHHDDEVFDYLGMPLTLGQVLVDRAFETWVHTQDIRRALHLSLAAPEEHQLMLLTDLGARLLPLLPRPADIHGALRLVLTGSGGGSWLLRIGEASTGGEAAGDVVSTLTLDSVDFCLLVAACIEPDTIDHEIVGDAWLAETALTIAPLLARL